MSITQETTEIACTTVQNVHVHARMLSQNVAPDIQLPFQSSASWLDICGNVQAHMHHQHTKHTYTHFYKHTVLYISHTANAVSEFVNLSCFSRTTSFVSRVN